MQQYCSDDTWRGLSPYDAPGTIENAWGRQHYYFHVADKDAEASTGPGQGTLFVCHHLATSQSAEIPTRDLHSWSLNHQLLHPLLLP